MTADEPHRFLGGGPGGQHIVQNEHILSLEIRTDQVTSLAMSLGFFPVEGEGEVASPVGEGDGRRTDKGYALVGGAKEGGRLDTVRKDRLGVKLP